MSETQCRQTGGDRGGQRDCELVVKCCMDPWSRLKCECYSMCYPGSEVAELNAGQIARFGVSVGRKYCVLGVFAGPRRMGIQGPREFAASGKPLG